MIRASTKKQIQSLLEECYFGDANFQVAYGRPEVDEAGKVAGVKIRKPDLYVKITFLPNPDYSFSVTQGETTIYPFRIYASPGKNILKDERSDTDKMETCVAEIPAWISRVKEEVIESNPINREIQQLRADIEARIASMESSLDDYFTKEEATAMSEKLAEFDARVTALSASNADLTVAVAKLTSTVEVLKMALTEVNKGTWFRMAGGKFMSFARSVFTSKEAREFALEAAKKLLLEGPK